ncbi:MAG: ATP-binding cassette domain-containing protein [Pirellulales bacterium]|nr:ATP-binding cassette domain-containing protein [Pirellulales bacterium]
MIEVKDLQKTYKGRKSKRVEALRGVSFSCEPGKVFGLLGPNGAGKTTALRIISTALRPTGGEGRVMGKDIVRESAEVRRNVGFLSTNTGLYGRLTPREVLWYFGRLFQMPPGEIESRIQELTTTFGMDEFLDRACDKLSTGMRQKVNIARTVLHSPPVIVFDEPTTGLDVITAKSIVEFIERCREEGRTVIFSTHHMTEVDRLCDQIGIIDSGQLAFLGEIDEFREKYGQHLDEGFIKLIEEQAA